MHGQVHCALKSMIIEEYDAVLWDKILEKCQLDELHSFNPYCSYPDSVTHELINACAEATGSHFQLQEILETFGTYYLNYCLTIGYKESLRSVAPDLSSFLQNLDIPFLLLHLASVRSTFPTFSYEETDASEIIKLHYFSSKAWFHPVLIGLISSVAKQCYGTEITINVESVLAGSPKDFFEKHIVYLVNLGAQKQECQLHYKASESLSRPNAIPKQVFCMLAPYHLILDKSLCVVQYGSGIKKQIGDEIRGVHLDNIFKVVHPPVSLDFGRILHFMKSIFILKSKGRSTDMLLKGEMILMEDCKHLVYIASPDLLRFEDMATQGLYLEDIALSDATRDILPMDHYVMPHLDISQHLLEQEMSLKMVSLNLEEEQKRADIVVNPGIPCSLSNPISLEQLRQPERFDQVSIVFVEVDNFKHMCGECPAADCVTMMKMLNTLISDTADDHDVYMMDTNGFQYILIAGAPDRIPDHATRLTNFAVDLTLRSQLISAPGGEPMKLLVGVHSGSVVGGILGNKIPRYCLFGDTVMVAGNIMRTSIPGKIHLSPDTQRILDRMLGYHFIERGQVCLEMVGPVTTFFVYGTPMRGQIPSLMWHPSADEIYHQLQQDSHLMSAQTSRCTML